MSADFPTGVGAEVEAERLDHGGHSALSQSGDGAVEVAGDVALASDVQPRRAQLRRGGRRSAREILERAAPIRGCRHPNTPNFTPARSGSFVVIHSANRDRVVRRGAVVRRGGDEHHTVGGRSSTALVQRRACGPEAAPATGGGEVGGDILGGAEVRAVQDQHRRAVARRPRARVGPFSTVHRGATCAAVGAAEPRPGFAAGVNRTGRCLMPLMKLDAQALRRSRSTSMSGSRVNSSRNITRDLQPGQVGAQAEVRSPSPKADVRVGVAADVEPVGLVEDRPRRGWRTRRR